MSNPNVVLDQEGNPVQSNGRNGRTNVEVARWLIGLALSALIAYFTAMGAIEQRMTAVETRQGAEFAEVMRVLGRMEADIRELRNRK